MPTPVSQPEFMEFIYHIAHDLNAPIRQMREMSRMLVSHLRDRTDSEDRKFLQHIISSGDKSEQMLAAITEYYRISNSIWQPAPVEPRAALSSACKRLQNELQGCSLLLEEETMPPTIPADMQMLTFLFQHLLDNAAKFHLLGAMPHIWVHAKKTNDGWCFYVEDNGIGVPPEYRTEIFSLFRRLHADGAYPGVGAGLAFARKITEMHSGVIDCDASALGGARFTVSLPTPSIIPQASH